METHRKELCCKSMEYLDIEYSIQTTFIGYSVLKLLVSLLLYNSCVRFFSRKK